MIVARMRRVEQQADQETAGTPGPMVTGGPPSALLAAGNQAMTRMAAQPQVFAQLWSIGSMINSAVETAGDIVHGFTEDSLRGSVGTNGDNNPGDIIIVMRLLAAAGYMDADMAAAITRFQTEVVKLPKPDGRIDPKGRTIRALAQARPAAPAPAPTQAPATRPPVAAPTIEPGDVESWPTVLPTAKRSAKEGTNITLKKGESEVTIPEMETPDLTQEQKELVDKIRANRGAIAVNPKLRMTTYKKVNKGMVYGDSQGNENLTPSSLQGAAPDKKTRARQIAFKELGTEGKVNSINTYDDQIITWGKGFSARSGSLNEVFMILFRDHPELRMELLRAGIDCTRKTWFVVNTDTGMIETGDNALRLMQFDEEMLTALINLGSGEEREQYSIDAQWEAMEAHAAKVPEYAYDWSESAIALCAHLAHWTPAFGWGVNPKTYSSTNGDLVEIAGTWARLAAKIPKWAATLANGAIIGPGDMMSPGHRLMGFAEGAGGTAVAAAADTVTGTRAEIGEDSAYSGHVLFPFPEDKKDKVKNKDKFYDIGSAGS
ncbi:hypothetical protein JOF56_005547 [Kibdelosporangium banguiense]|uniref:Uncharacterized protein n=1 Tax=Kibdelosporangium banguiense TaxID=1365924 RepID=A0ABS4TL63_9PSEU|nr:hypothetical protein [Kibdelosporangium banguiense]MBP2325162.1 hypothetical protein [Kibdelosporangium banguiense]